MSSPSIFGYPLPSSATERKLLMALPIAVAASLIVAVYAPGALVIFCAALVLLFFLDRPYELLLLMVFMIPFNFVFTVGQIPVAVELLKLFLWIPFFATRKAGAEFKTSKYNKYFAVWGIILASSLIRSNDLPYTVKESVRLASNIGLCYLVLNLVDSREKLLRILRVL